MIKETKTSKEVVERQTVCDDCGQSVVLKYRCCANYCFYCGKDICSECIAHEEDDGDGVIFWCKKCWEIGETYLKKIQEFDDQIDLLWAELETKCKAERAKDLQTKGVK